MNIGDMHLIDIVGKYIRETQLRNRVEKYSQCSIGRRKTLWGARYLLVERPHTGKYSEHTGDYSDYWNHQWIFSLEHFRHEILKKYTIVKEWKASWMSFLEIERNKINEKEKILKLLVWVCSGGRGMWFGPVWQQSKIWDMQPLLRNTVDAIEKYSWEI